MPARATCSSAHSAALAEYLADRKEFTGTARRRFLDFVTTSLGGSRLGAAEKQIGAVDGTGGPGSCWHGRRSGERVVGLAALALDGLRSDHHRTSFRHQRC